MDFGIAGVAAITVICYLVGMGAKETGKVDKYIPTICGACGAVFGVVGMLTMPEFPAADPISALAVGIVSGLAATGFDQAIKQLKD